MIKIVKGRYKRISMKVDESLDVIVKAPRRVADEKINEFILAHRSWILKQKNRLIQANQILDKYDFNKYVYVLGEPQNFSNILNRKNLYYKVAESILTELVNRISTQTKLSFSGVKITHSVRNWGSMDRYKHIKLNVKLIVLSRELVEYVIIHELCHGVEFNHSKQFWHVVEKHCPNYKNLKKELNYYGGLLRTNIY